MSSSAVFNGRVRKWRRLLESRWLFLLAIVLLRVALELGYWGIVSPVFSYAGFEWAPDAVKYVESWALLIGVGFIAPFKMRVPSDFFVVTLLCGFLLPLLSFYALANQQRSFLYIVLFGYLLVDGFRRGTPVRLPFIEGGPYLALALVLTGSVVVSAWFVISGGIQYLNFDLTKVYEYRESVDALINIGLMSYINTWATKVFGPVLLALALWRRQYWLAVIVVSLHVFWFGVSAHKSVLFYPFVVLGIWYWFRKTNALSLIPLGMFTVVALALGLFWLLNDTYIPSLFIRRVFYVVANNTFDYYEFFSDHSFVYWSNSVTASFISYPYRVNPADLIGLWRDTEGHVNNSFLATGFMHAGIFGVILYGVLAGFIFRIIDSLASQGVPVWVAVAALIVPSRSMLISADLPTSLLTHGIGVAMLILFLLRSKRRARVLVGGVAAKSV